MHFHNFLKMFIKIEGETALLIINIFFAEEKNFIKKMF